MPRQTDRPVLFLAVLALAAAAIGAYARPSDRARNASPGEFDYYVLSLSWSPAFCLESPGAAQCNGPRRFGFIVHGLWPQYERGWPQDCAATPLPDAIAHGVADLMPAGGLVSHEWSVHGTCSGLDPAEYFALLRRAYESVALPALAQAGSAVEQAPAAISGAFFHANPRLPPDSLVLICSRQAAPRLREVRVCFARDLTPRACSADARREGCRASSVIVAPIR
jgi:ribonuclease T2